MRPKLSPVDDGDDEEASGLSVWILLEEVRVLQLLQLHPHPQTLFNISTALSAKNSSLVSCSRDATRQSRNSQKKLVDWIWTFSTSCLMFAQESHICTLFFMPTTISILWISVSVTMAGQLYLISDLAASSAVSLSMRVHLGRLMRYTHLSQKTNSKH